MNAIFNFDASILLWIQNNIRNAVLDPIMIFITHLGDKGMFWTVLTLLMICFRKTRKAAVASDISMVIALVVVNLALKNWVARVRPYELIEGLQLMVEKQHDFSFPSGHAANSLACAWVLFKLMDRKYGVPALILALLISLSRLYVAVHYPTDVIVGIVIGILAAELAIVIERALAKKFPAFKDFIRSKPAKKKGKKA